jgi:hypothetical protein
MPVRRRVTTLLMSIATIAFGGVLIGQGHDVQGLLADVLGVSGVWVSAVGSGRP